MVSNTQELVRRMLESDDDESLKDLLGGAEYLVPKIGKVIRAPGAHIRWSRVFFGEGLDFCVSYLTPVAFYERGNGTFMTEKFWSTATQRHIKAWLTEVSSREYHLWADVQAYATLLPQNQITQKFKAALEETDFPERDIKRLKRVPGSVPYLKGDSEDRINHMRITRHDPERQ